LIRTCPAHLLGMKFKSNLFSKSDYRVKKQLTNPATLWYSSHIWERSEQIRITFTNILRADLIGDRLLQLSSESSRFLNMEKWEINAHFQSGNLKETTWKT